MPHPVDSKPIDITLDASGNGEARTYGKEGNFFYACQIEGCLPSPNAVFRITDSQTGAADANRFPILEITGYKDGSYFAPRKQSCTSNGTLIPGLYHKYHGDYFHFNVSGGKANDSFKIYVHRGDVGEG